VPAAEPLRNALRETPNPVWSRAEFSIDSTLDPQVLDIFDVTGRLVASIDAVRGASLQWEPNQSAGIYFARLRASGHTETVKFVVLR
jgi:hypothetical protein